MLNRSLDVHFPQTVNEYSPGFHFHWGFFCTGRGCVWPITLGLKGTDVRNKMQAVLICVQRKTRNDELNVTVCTFQNLCFKTKVDETNGCNYEVAINLKSTCLICFSQPCLHVGLMSSSVVMVPASMAPNSVIKSTTVRTTATKLAVSTVRAGGGTDYQQQHIITHIMQQLSQRQPLSKIANYFCSENRWCNTWQVSVQIYQLHAVFSVFCHTWFTLKNCQLVRFTGDTAEQITDGCSWLHQLILPHEKLLKETHFNWVRGEENSMSKFIKTLII